MLLTASGMVCSTESALHPYPLPKGQVLLLCDAAQSTAPAAGSGAGINEDFRMFCPFSCKTSARWLEDVMALESTNSYLMRQMCSWGILMLGNVACWCSGHSSTITGTVSLSPPLVIILGTQ